MKNPEITKKANRAAEIAIQKRNESGLSPRARHDQKLGDVIWFLKKFGFSTEPLLSFLTDDKTNRLIASLVKKKLITFDLCWLNTGTTGRMAKLYKLTPSGYESYQHDGNETRQKNYFNKVRRLDQKNFRNDLISQYYAIRENKNSENPSFLINSAFEKDISTASVKVADFETVVIDDDSYGEPREYLTHFEIETSPKSGKELDEFIQRIEEALAKTIVGDESEYYSAKIKIFVSGISNVARYRKAFNEGTEYNLIEKDRDTRRRYKVGTKRMSFETAFATEIFEIPSWLNPASRNLGKPSPLKAI